MAAAATHELLLEVYGEPEKGKALNSLFSEYNTNEYGSMQAEQLQAIYERLRDYSLSIPQIEASIKHVCSGYPEFDDCDEEELLDVLQEMDRRCFLAKDLQWEFTVLDKTGKGSIPVQDAMFLFKMVHGDFFSMDRFNNLINQRIVKDCDITFEEIEVELCNIPTYHWIEEQIAAQKRIREKELQEIAKAKEEEELRRIKIERLKKEEEIKLAEEKKRREMELQKLEKEKEKKLAEEKKKREMELQMLKEEEERKLEEEAERKAEEERRAQEQQLLAEEKQRKAEEEQHLREEQEEEEKELQRLKDEEEERLKQEEIERKLKEEEDQRKAEEKEKRAVWTREKWKHLKDLAVKNLLKPDDLQALRERRKSISTEQAVEDENTAEEILQAEDNFEEEVRQLEEMMKKAKSDEEREKARVAKEKAEADALKNKEKRLRLQLGAAVKLRNRPKLVVSIDEAKESKIKALKPDIGKAEKVCDSIKYGEDLEDAMAKRDMPLIEEAVNTIKSKKCEDDHVVKLLEADKLMEKLKRLEKAKKDILELNQRTIAIVRSYSKPLPAIRDVMIGTYIILGYKEKELQEWKFIQALLGRTGKESLKRMCTTLEASKINLNLAKDAEKRYLDKHTLESITDISAGVGTFYAWSTTMIEEARNWIEDSEFRKAIEEKRKLEEEETKNLQKKRKTKKKGAK